MKCSQKMKCQQKEDSKYSLLFYQTQNFGSCLAKGNPICILAYCCIINLDFSFPASNFIWSVFNLFNLVSLFLSFILLFVGSLTKRGGVQWTKSLSTEVSMKWLIPKEQSNKIVVSYLSFLILFYFCWVHLYIFPIKLEYLLVH